MASNVKEEIQKIIDKASQVLFNKSEVLQLALVGVLCRGHLLIEDIPGVGKTTLVYLLAKLLGIDINRIQFTNDMLPADIIGSSIYQQKTGRFDFKKGPLFGEFILADELNRATSRTQSALLQSMEERRINIDGMEYPMDENFLIMATQNPFQQIGTYQLPESQIDRFFMGLRLGLPQRQYEKEVIQGQDGMEAIKEMDPICNKDQLGKWRKQIRNIKMNDSILNYIIDILEMGRTQLDEGYLLSPRSGRNLGMASRAMALIKGREFVIPEDVKQVAPAVLGHRIGSGRGVKYGSNKIKKLLERVPIS